MASAAPRINRKVAEGQVLMLAVEPPWVPVTVQIIQDKGNRNNRQEADRQHRIALTFGADRASGHERKA